jgi:sialate O-acetylesterase
MLLQRELNAPIWGWAAAGEEVTVKFAGQEKKTTADAHGKWMVRLDPLEANATGQTLEVAGKNTIQLTDVLVGDVWICSGQSNMEFQLSQVIDAQQEVAAAKYEGIRLFNVPGHTTAPLPQDNCPGNWQACTPQSAAGFSAVGYFFGRKFHLDTKVPVGLIGTNWGGTRIEPWIAPIGFRMVPELKDLSTAVDRFDPSTPAGKATWDKYVGNVEKWVTKTEAALKSNEAVTSPPSTPGYTSSSDPTAIYNSMVHPLAPYGLRGALWYQGESNGGEGVEYFHKMQALIEGWRSVWGEKDFPLYFYFVQLADFQKPTDNPAGGDGWARIRDAQTQSLTIPHTGMATIIDIGAANDIHPRNKQDVGARLALWALRDVAQQDVVVSGPQFKSMKVEGNKIRLSYDHVGSGLMVGKKEGLQPTEEVSSGKLARFAIAGADKTWQWADATIDGETVVLSSEKVAEPVAVRYAWSMNPAGANLYNKEGLPAVPFRTDHW